MKSIKAYPVLEKIGKGELAIIENGIIRAARPGDRIKVKIDPKMFRNAIGSTGTN